MLCPFSAMGLAPEINVMYVCIIIHVLMHRLQNLLRVVCHWLFMQWAPVLKVEKGARTLHPASTAERVSNWERGNPR